MAHADWTDSQNKCKYIEESRTNMNCLFSFALRLYTTCMITKLQVKRNKQLCIKKKYIYIHKVICIYMLINLFDPVTVFDSVIVFDPAAVFGSATIFGSANEDDGKVRTRRRRRLRRCPTSVFGCATLSSAHSGIYNV